MSMKSSRVYWSHENAEENQGDTFQPTSRTCSLDYGALPTILLHSLPLRVQRLLANRIARAHLPLFVLVTHKAGQWCLVQLQQVDSLKSNDSIIQSKSDNHFLIQSSVKSRSLGNTIVIDSLNSTPDPMYDSSSVISSTEVQLDLNTIASYVNSCVHFRFTSKLPDHNWQCPFCKAIFSINASSPVDVLGQHMRLHVELRCCVDCVTLLPNNVFETNFKTLYPHHCDDLVSTIPKSQSNSNQVETFSNNVLDLVMKSPTQTNQADTSSDSTDDLLGNYRSKRSLTSIISDQLHSDSVHQQTIPPAPKRVCLACNITFNESAKFQQHMKNVHRGRRFICHDCNISFSTKGNLTTHYNEVHNLNTGLHCNLCDKRLSNKFNMDRHIRMIHGSMHSSVTSSSGADIFNAQCPSPIQSGSTNRNLISENTANCMDILVPPTSPRQSPDLQPCKSDSNRGYYLYLTAPSDQTDKLSTSSDNTIIDANVLSTDNIASNSHSVMSSNRISLVAEVDLTPCSVISQQSHFEVCGKNWSQNVHILKPISGSGSSNRLVNN